MYKNKNWISFNMFHKFIFKLFSFKAFSMHMVNMFSLDYAISQSAALIKINLLLLSRWCIPNIFSISKLSALSFFVYNIFGIIFKVL